MICDHTTAELIRDAERKKVVKYRLVARMDCECLLVANSAGRLFVVGRYDFTDKSHTARPMIAGEVFVERLSHEAEQPTLF